MELVAMIGAETAATTAASTVGMTAAESAFLASAQTAAGVGAGASTFGSVFTLSNIATGLSLASMASTVFGGAREGAAAARSLELQAKEDLLSAKQSELAGKQEANDIMQGMLQTIAAQRLAFSGAGIDPSFGTPDALAKNTRRLAESQLGTSRDNTIMLAASRRRGAYARLEERGFAKSAPLNRGLATAGGTLADMIERREMRG